MNGFVEDALEYFSSSHIFRPPPKDFACIFPIQRKYNKMVRTIDNHEIHVRLITPSGSKCTFDNYEKSNQILVYAHGNATDVDAEQSFSEWLCHINNCNVIIFDYPGYGKSSGETPSICSMNSAAMAVICFVHEELKHDLHDIICVGKSLGSVAVLHCAAQKEFSNLGGVFLISPIASAIRCLSICAHLPSTFVSSMDKYVIPNINNIKKVHCLVGIVHGKSDSVVPCSNGQELANHCPSWNRFPILIVGHPADHSNLEAVAGSLFIENFTKFCKAVEERSTRNKSLITNDADDLQSFFDM